MGRPVAIKVLHADISTDRDRRVFETECQAMGVLSRHPNIVTAYGDAFTRDGRACVVMELYHGNYRDRLEASGPLPIRELLDVGIKIAGALQAVHDTGILHRDIKPHNVFVSDFGEPALGDFGISTIDDQRSMTSDGGLSVAYAAPEVIDDGTVDYLSDVYSLAATLYHLAAGRPPFEGKQMSNVMRRILNEEPAPIGRSDVPAAVERVLMAGLSKVPTGRPDSAGELAWALQDVQPELGSDRTPVPVSNADRFDPVGDRSTNSRVGPDPSGDAEATVGHPTTPPTGDVDRPAPDVGGAWPDLEATIMKASDPDESPMRPVSPSGSDEIPRPALSNGRRELVISAVIVVAVVALVTYALVGLL